MPDSRKGAPLQQPSSADLPRPGVSQLQPHRLVGLDVVVVSTNVVRSAGELAERDRLRGYDAVHLAAGLTAGASVFAAADSRLLAAARHHGFATADPLQHP